MKALKTLSAVIFLAAVPLWALAADVTGTWKATFDTQMGMQEYTYELTQKGTVVSGIAKNPMGQTNLTEGKVEGETVTFVEDVNFGGMAISISYTGKIVSPTEIEFTRQVGTFATEKATAKRL